MSEDRDVSTISTPPRPCGCDKSTLGKVYSGGPGSTRALAVRIGPGGQPFLARQHRKVVGGIGVGQLAWFVGIEADWLVANGLLTIEP